MGKLKEMYLGVMEWLIDGTTHHAPRTKFPSSRFTLHVLRPMSQTNWETRYQTNDMPWEKGAPSPGLVDFLAAHPDLPRGTVCVPGCGTGHDVRAWAGAGFDVS